MLEKWDRPCGNLTVQNLYPHIGEVGSNVVGNNFLMQKCFTRDVPFAYSNCSLNFLLVIGKGVVLVEN